MSCIKGFELKFRGHNVQMSERQMDVMEIKILKQHDLFSIFVGGIMSDGQKLSTLLFENDLCEGDEIIIERKELEQSSPPVAMPVSYAVGKEPAEVAHNQYRLALFYDLEAYLTEKGLLK